MFTISSNLFNIIFVDTLIFSAGLGCGFLLGRVGLTKLKAEVEALKAIIFPNTTVTPTK
jgi:hypothetical protein